MGKNNRLKRRHDSRLGRLLGRLLGEEKGAVMMEYVILAVLIAAGAVVAVAMFGKTLVGMFDTAGKGATADHTGAAAGQGAAGNQTGANQALEVRFMRFKKGEGMYVDQIKRVPTDTRKALTYEKWRRSQEKGSAEQ